MYAIFVKFYVPLCVLLAVDYFLWNVLYSCFNSCFWLLFCFCMHVFLLFFSVYVTVVIGCLPLLPLLPTLLLKYYYYHLDANDDHLHCVRRNVQWWPRSMLQSSTFEKWLRTSGRRVSSLKWGGNSRGGSCPDLLPAHTRPSVLTHGTSPCSSATSWEIIDTQTQVRFGSFLIWRGDGRGVSVEYRHSPKYVISV
jgi:hypothetical protein